MFSFFTELETPNEEKLEEDEISLHSNDTSELDSSLPRLSDEDFLIDSWSSNQIGFMPRINLAPPSINGITERTEFLSHVVTDSLPVNYSPQYKEDGVQIKEDLILQRTENEVEIRNHIELESKGHSSTFEIRPLATSNVHEKEIDKALLLLNGSNNIESRKKEGILCFSSSSSSSFDEDDSNNHLLTGLEVLSGKQKELVSASNTILAQASLHTSRNSENGVDFMTSSSSPSRFSNEERSNILSWSNMTSDSETSRSTVYLDLRDEIKSLQIEVNIFLIFEAMDCTIKEDQPLRISF